MLLVTFRWSWQRQVMTLEAALALISELQVQNAALREQNAHLQADNAAQRERMAVLEQRIAALEAEKRPPPPWVKANRVKGEKPADERPQPIRCLPRGTTDSLTSSLNSNTRQASLHVSSIVGILTRARTIGRLPYHRSAPACRTSLWSASRCYSC